MKIRNEAKITLFIFVIIFCLSFFALAKGPGGGPNPGGPNPSPDPIAELDDEETAHLKFMRAEEKLAHDVYKYLDNYLDPENPVYPFANIVESEANHLNSMADKLRIYGIEDLNADDAEGEFHPDNYGSYFDSKYDFLIGLGLGHPNDPELLKAYLTGGFIEELDMNDIMWCPDEVQRELGYTPQEGKEECGMAYTDEDLLIESYGNLYAGSEDHLRAFAGSIVLKYANTEEYPHSCYQAQYLEQSEVNAILGVSDDDCPGDE